MIVAAAGLAALTLVACTSASSAVASPDDVAAGNDASAVDGFIADSGAQEVADPNDAASADDLSTEDVAPELDASSDDVTSDDVTSDDVTSDDATLDDVGTSDPDSSGTDLEVTDDVVASDIDGPSDVTDNDVDPAADVVDPGDATDDASPMFTPEPGSWSSKSQTAAGRAGGAVGAYGGTIIVTGGYDSTGTVTGSLESYSIVSNTWEQSAKDMPTPRGAAAAAMVVDGGIGGRLFVAGGLDILGNLTQVVERYSPGNQAWTGPPTGFPHLPKLSCCAAATAIGDTMWIAGGHDGARHFWSYQPSVGVWYDHPDLKTGRSFPVIVAVGDRLVVAGGAAHDVPGPNEPLVFSVEAYDVATDTWESLSPAPEPVMQAAAVEHNGRMWVLGGRRGDGTLSDSIWVLDLAQGWMPAAPMPRARARHGVVSTVEGLWVIGGEGVDGYLTAVDLRTFL